MHYSQSFFQDTGSSHTTEDLLLSTNKVSISRKRKIAYTGLQLQASKMLKLAKAKCPPAAVGDTVKVPIPDVDRGRTDPRNLLATVLSVDNDQYLLGTKEGHLKQHYSRNQFTVCKQQFLSSAEVPDVELSLREIVTAQSLTGGQGFKRCLCKGKCDSKRCSCKAQDLLCNSKCHASGPCKNK